MLIESPKKFIGLHSHSTFSVGDAIGRPQDHIDFAMANEMDALALTDHGNMAGFSHQQVYVDKLKKKGINFKGIAGVEAYYIPSLDTWHELYAQAKTNGTLKPKAVKKGKPVPGDELASTEADLEAIKEDKDDEEDGGTIVENEEESKSNKYNNPLKARSHLVLLAKNSEGLKSIFRIVSDSAIDGFYNVPRVDMKSLRENANGNIIATTACVAGFPARIIFNNQPQDIDWKDWKPNNVNFEKIQGELAEAIKGFQEALGPENYYLEMQFNKLGAQHLVNMHLIEAAKRTGAKLVVTCDAHYSNPKHWKEREIYKALSWHGVNKDPLPESVEDLKCELYPKNASQVWDTFLKTADGYDFYDPQVVKEAIERTHEIAHDQIGDVKADRSVKLPALTKLVPKDDLERIRKDLGEEKGSDDEAVAFRELKELAIKGLKWRKTTSQPYIDRLKEELDVIKHLKLSRYFLTYYWIMDVVTKQQLTGPGRGSAAGSLLAYVLNITQVDAVKHGTLFARFLNKFKAGMADIDSDFSDREEAVKIISEFFGAENVIPVSNFAQLQLASLCKDLARLFDVPFELVNSYTYKMRSEAMAVAKQRPGFDAQVWDFTLEVAQADSPSYNEFVKEMEAYPAFHAALTVLFKQMRTVSKHAGGVIITEDARSGMPLLKAKGGIQTPWPEGLANRHLEDFGLLKFDILGLGTLRMFEDCIRKILKKQGIKHPTFAQVKDWYEKHLHPDNNEMDDQNVYKHVFWDSNYAGIFQFVQPNTQAFMAQMKPTSVYDIAIATSIFRPGPLAAGVDKMFLQNRLNPDDVKYKTPLLKEVYANTSGLLVFQEQLQMTYHKLAGVPLEQTDGVRKAFTKKDMSNKAKAAADRDKLRTEFADKCLSVNGIDPAISNDIFDEMEKLVAYSFNFSHALSYGMISYMCAYLLTYHADEWITTYIDYCTTEKGTVAGKEDPKVIAIQEARQLGYEISKPDINISEYEFTNDPRNLKSLVPSMASLKYVGKMALGEIKQYRPYRTVEDLVVNPDNTWRHSKFNKRSLETLIKLEALDSMELVGPDKTFRTYKEMYDILVVGYDKLKSTSNKKKNNDVSAMLKDKIAEYRTQHPEPSDWTTKDKIDFSSELAGTVDINLVLPPGIRSQLKDMKIKSIDEWTTKGSYWAIVSEAKVAVTKTGKPYLRMKLFADSAEQYNCFVWNYKNKGDNIPHQYDVVAGMFDKSNFGLSTWEGKFYKLNEEARG